MSSATPAARAVVTLDADNHDLTGENFAVLDRAPELIATVSLITMGNAAGKPSDYRTEPSIPAALLSLAYKTLPARTRVDQHAKGVVWGWLASSRPASSRPLTSAAMGDFTRSAWANRPKVRGRPYTSTDSADNQAADISALAVAVTAATAPDWSR